MIKDNQELFNRLHIVLDALIVAVTYLAAWYLRIILFPQKGAGVLPMETYFAALYFIVPGHLILYSILQLYKSKRYSSAWKEAYEIVKANLIGFGIIFIILYAINEPDFSRSMIMVFTILNTIVMIGMRTLIRKSLRLFRKKGFNVKYILLVGYSRATEEYIDRILSNPQWGYVVRGILDDRVPAGTLYRGVKVLGTMGNLQYVLPNSKLDEIGVTLALADYDKLEEIVNMREKSGVHTKFIPDYNSVIPSRPYTEDLSGLPVF